jgi:nicotinamidase/pyrazinamidase
VLYSALDAVELGFRVYVVLDACRGVNASPGDVEKACALMKKQGVQLVNTKDVRICLNRV